MRQNTEMLFQLFGDQQRQAGECDDRERAKRSAAQAREDPRAQREAARDEALTAMLLKVVERMT